MALEPLGAKWESFGFEVASADGNNPADIVRALTSFDKDGTQPACHPCPYGQGQGGFLHGGPGVVASPDPVGRSAATGDRGAGMTAPVITQDLRDAVVRELCSAADDGLALVVLVSDSTSTSSIGPFQTRFLERLINVGIAEQNLLGMAAGLSLGGFISVTANAACFLTARSMRAAQDRHLLFEHEREASGPERGRGIRTSGEHPPRDRRHLDPARLRHASRFSPPPTAWRRRRSSATPLNIRVPSTFAWTTWLCHSCTAPEYHFQPGARRCGGKGAI